jgi:hypothetical protein
MRKVGYGNPLMDLGVIMECHIVPGSGQVKGDLTDGNTE